MKAHDAKKIKNVVLLGHAGSGKTTLAEAMLFEAGAITRRGTVEDKNTVSDFHDLERERGNSIFSSLMNIQWKDNKINILDTPGYDDFVGEVISSMSVADTGVIVLNAQNGVEVGTEIIWDYVNQFKLPTLFVVNQVDSDKSDFVNTVDQAKERFGNNVVVVQYPYTQGQDFDAIIDVLKMTMYKFPADGGKPEKLPIPDEEKAKADQLHNELVEAVAVNDESLMELYFDKGELSEEEMAQGMKASMINHDIYPVFCCSSKRNMGSGRVMGFIRDIAPAAVDMPPATRMSGKTLACDSNGPACLFVFKTASEANLGNISYFKVYSGSIKSGDDLTNSVTQGSERINQIFVINGKKREQVDKLVAGDIGITVKLKGSPTNSTLHEKNNPYRIAPIEFPSPRIQVAVDTENKNDMEKLVQALTQLQQEDPTLILEHSKELKQILLYGQGELHLSMARWKVENQYKVKFSMEKPKVAFRETIQKSVKTSYRHKKQSGGAGQFGEVHILVEPYYEGMPKPEGLNVRKDPEVFDLEWGGKFVCYNCIVGGAIDAKYMSAIQKGILERMEDGPLTGSYVRDVRVSVYDGKMHPVDSNDMAFKIAAAQAFKQAFSEAKPKLMEPIHLVEILVSGDSMGDVIADLNTRRAIIMGMEASGHYQKITAKVPLMELYKYSSILRSLSQGAAKHSQKFAEFAPVPADVQQELVKAHQATQEA